MLEIRELVIEARVTDDAKPGQAAAQQGITDSERARLIEQIVRQVLETLNEQRERL